jgi:aqualysin 1
MRARPRAPSVTRARVAIPTLLALAALLAPATASARPASYIVVLEDRATSSRALAREHARRHGLKRSRTFGEALEGYAARIPRSRLAAVRRDARVAYVEPDRKVRAFAQALPWGVNRVDADTSSTRAGNGSGAVRGVNAFVIDSGVNRHPDLNLVSRVSFAGGGSSDCLGHGTSVAGTLAARDNTSAVVGVAPGAPLTSVKVLDCFGEGWWSDVIAGIDYVTRRARETPGPEVANISFGGFPSRSLDDAVRRSVAGGVFYAISAGNDGDSACSISPARAGGATTNGIATVAATDARDEEPYWSNFGGCVDLWAPGVSVLSTSAGGGTSRASGTSWSAPHVAGGAALYRSRHAVTPRSLEWKLKASAERPGARSKDDRTIRRLFVGGSAGF